MEQWASFKRSPFSNDSKKNQTEYALYIKRMASVNKLFHNSGLEKWRRTQAEQLSKIVQKRLWLLNNPKGCEGDDATFFYCHAAHHKCGWGCMMHHLANCMFNSIATARTLVIDSQYYTFFTEYFLQPSQTCSHLIHNFTRQVNNLVCGSFNPPILCSRWSKVWYPTFTMRPKRTELSIINLLTIVSTDHS